MVLIPGTALAERMRQYAAFSRREVLAQLAAQKSAGLANRPLVEFDFPPDLVKSGTVAVIYDETEGTRLFWGFRRVLSGPSPSHPSSINRVTATGLSTTSTTTASHLFPSGEWPIGTPFVPLRCCGGCLAARASTGSVMVRWR